MSTTRTRALLLLAGAVILALLLWPSDPGSEAPPRTPERFGEAGGAPPDASPAPTDEAESPAETLDPHTPTTPVLRGRVVDPEGRPIAGADIRADDADPYGGFLVGSDRETGRAWRRTGPDGRFEIELPPSLVRAGRIEALVRAEGWAPAVSPEIRVEPGRAPDEVILVLSKGATFSAQIVEEGTDIPVPGASLHVSPGIHERDFVHLDGHRCGESPGMPTHLPPAAVSDATGRLVLRDLIPRDYLFLVSAAGFDPRHLGWVTVSAETALRVELHRRPPGEIRGFVVFPDGTPVEWAQVEVPRADGTYWRGCFSGADGSFRIEGLPPGAHRIAVAPMAGTGFVPRTFEGVVTGPSDLRLVVERGIRLRIRLVDPGGNPCPGVEIHVRGSLPGRTNAEGWIEVGGLVEKTYTVQVDLRPYWGVWNRLEKQLEVKTGMREAVIVGPERHSLGGILVDGEGRPLPGVRLHASAVDAVTRTDEQGRFLFERIKPGKYRIRLDGRREVHPPVVESGLRDHRLVAPK
jgi:hypothetical protein